MLDAQNSARIMIEPRKLMLKSDAKCAKGPIPPDRVTNQKRTNHITLNRWHRRRSICRTGSSHSNNFGTSRHNGLETFSTASQRPRNATTLEPFRNNLAAVSRNLLRNSIAAASQQLRSGTTRAWQAVSQVVRNGSVTALQQEPVLDTNNLLNM